MEQRRTRNIIGLMSGTSCDGVDAVLVEVAGKGLDMRVRPLAHRHHRYPVRLRRRLLAVMAPAETTTEELCALHAAVGAVFAEAATELLKHADCRAADVDLIGSHGQTICHLPPKGAGRPGGSTLQIGDASIIATRTGVTTVSDFRPTDVALGGQGAPLVPWTDYVLFRDASQSRAIQNVGGIANVTYLPPGGAPEDVLAFDTGPGNMVVDEIVRRATQGRRSYDRNGMRAARGTIDERLLRRWLRHPYFTKPPPKSCGREQFGSAFVDASVDIAHLSERADELIATATALTARTIAEGYARFLPNREGKPAVNAVIVCGGGSRNRTMMNMLAEDLGNVEIVPIDDLGIGYQAKEAVSFAMLAAACADGVPASLPRVTGAVRAAILGRITPA